MTNSLTDDQRELYNIYLVSKGNRDYLFANDIYANETDAPSYTIPGEALTDATFRRLITEAEKYLGFPYVWGGSNPSTSFDCSGFVCWVFSNSGVYPLSRTTAQGIYNQCARVSPQDAKPGDIIFFKGTYNTSEVSHVGLYVGNGMMIHAGNPIQYTSVNTNYWTQHFFAYGRLSN
nr:C40 family peptidase [Eubacterium sp. BL-380-WT-2B]